MERFVDAGKICSIGLSNWYVEELETFLPQVDTLPALVQNEIHPYYQENDVIPYIQGLDITVQGWYPLGGRGHTQALLNDPVILEIAQAHGVSAAQVILRWNLQKGVVVIPGSSNPDHILENTQLYHFELSGEEMERINALDKNEKHDWYYGAVSRVMVNTAPPSSRFAAAISPPMARAAERAMARPRPKLPPLPL